MTCPRCQGLLISDYLYNKDEALSVLNIWRCLNCGETFDSMIMRNRTTLIGKEDAKKSKSSPWAGAGNSMVVPS